MPLYPSSEYTRHAGSSLRPHHAKYHTMKDDVAAPVNSASRLTLGTCLGFGVGTVGVSVMLNGVTAYFLTFMSTVLGQSPALAGLLLMGSKLYDAVCDVGVGIASDRTRTRWGRRRPYLLAGAVLSAVSFLMLFAPPHLGGSSLVPYMIVGLLLYSTGYSLFNVPYMTMPSEMTDGFHERTRLLSFRTLFVCIGQLAALAGTSALIRFGGGGAAGYRLMGAVMGALILLTMAGSFFGTAGARTVPPVVGTRRLTLGEVAGIFRNRPFAILAGAKVFQFLGFASVASTGLLFFLNVLHVGYTGQIELAVSANLASALALPFWVRAGKLLGKRLTYVAGVALFCLTDLSWLLADPSITAWGVVIRGVFAGIGSSAIILMSVSMLADTMAYDRDTTGAQREGAMSATIAVIEKVSYALGVAVVGALLNIMHYHATFGGHLVAQPHSAQVMLYMGYAVIPVLMFGFNGVLLCFYGLDEAGARAAAPRV